MLSEVSALAKRYTFEFQTPPQAQERGRIGKFGNIYIPQKSQNFKASIKSEIDKAWKLEPLHDDLYVEITFRFERPKSVKRPYPSVKPDVDNCTKILLDALNKKLWHDDSIIIGLMAMKVYSAIPGIDLNVYVL